MTLVTQVMFRLDSAPFIVDLAMGACAIVFAVSFIAGFAAIYFMLRKAGFPRSWNDLRAGNNLRWPTTVILSSYAGLLLSFVSLMWLAMMFGQRVE